jgi:nucleoid-associated protein YejK
MATKQFCVANRLSCTGAEQPYAAFRLHKNGRVVADHFLDILKSACGLQAEFALTN